MAKNVPPVAPAAGNTGEKSDPFTRVGELFHDRTFHLSRIIDETCANRLAFRVDGPKVRPQTYLLADDTGADEAAINFGRYLRRNPPPNTLRDFDNALKEARELVARAEIPFDESDTTFRQWPTVYDRVNIVAILPSSARADFPHSQLVGPVPLNSVSYNELNSCQHSYERLRAFTSQARGRGLLPATTEISSHSPNWSRTRHPRHCKRVVTAKSWAE